MIRFNWLESILTGFYNMGNRADEIGNDKGLQSFLAEQISIPSRFARENELEMIKHAAQL